MSSHSKKPGEIFRIEACRCKRCGGLLTSKDAIKNGMGRTCMLKAKAEEKAKRPEPNQFTFDGFFNSDADINIECPEK